MKTCEVRPVGRRTHHSGKYVVRISGMGIPDVKKNKKTQNNILTFKYVKMPRYLSQYLFNSMFKFIEWVACFRVGGGGLDSSGI